MKLICAVYVTRKFQTNKTNALDTHGEKSNCQANTKADIELCIM